MSCLLRTPGLRIRHVYFPIGKDRADYEARKAKDTRGLAASAKALIDHVQPYKGGNDALWQLHELNIIDKHRTLITAGSAFQSLDIGSHLSDTFPIDGRKRAFY